MMRFTRGFLSIATLLVLAAGAQAGVTAVKNVVIDQSVVPGFTANDIQIDFTGFLRGQQMIMELTQGSMFQQEDFGGDTPVSSALWAAFADVQFDSWVSIGGRQSNGAKPPATQNVLVVGGAVNLQPGAVQKFDTTGANIAWAPATGIDVNGGTNYVTAQLTLSNDAQGTFRYFGSTAAGTGDPLEVQGTVVDGVITFGMPNIAPIVTGGGIIPVVLDQVNSPPLPTTAMFQFTATDDEPLSELEWSIQSFVYQGGGTNTGAQPTIDATGKLSWPADGWAGGQYVATVRATDAGDLFGEASVTFDLTVPEPSTFALLGLALVGFAGCRRK